MLLSFSIIIFPQGSTLLSTLRGRSLLCQIFSVNKMNRYGTGRIDWTLPLSIHNRWSHLKLVSADYRRFHASLELICLAVTLIRMNGAREARLKRDSSLRAALSLSVAAAVIDINYRHTVHHGDHVLYYRTEHWFLLDLFLSCCRRDSITVLICVIYFISCYQI